MGFLSKELVLQGQRIISPNSPDKAEWARVPRSCRQEPLNLGQALAQSFTAIQEQKRHNSRLPRQEPRFSQLWGLPSPPFPCSGEKPESFTSSEVIAKSPSVLVCQRLLRKQREERACAHRGGTVKARYHFSRWKTGVHPCIYQPVSKHLPPGWVWGVFLWFIFKFLH